MWTCNFLKTLHFHEASWGKQLSYWLKSRFGKVSGVLTESY